MMFEVRNNAMFIAGGYMVSKGEENKALKTAMELHYDEIDKAAIEDAKKRPPEKVEPKAAENKAGSYERAMQTLGNPHVWRGR